MRDLLKNEISGWKKWEILWLLIACSIIAGLSIYWGDTLVDIISATTGVACVVCTGKGKLSAYLFGLINSVLYAIISYKAALYGETLLNAIYYVPMQFIGFYVWSKHMNSETMEVEKKHMHYTLKIALCVVIAICVWGFAVFLNYIGDAMPIVDSFTTVCSIAAMLISVKMFAEQWWIWIAVDVFSIYMWWCDFKSGSGNMGTLLMWVVYLFNAIFMLIKWEKEAIKLEKEQENNEI